MRNNTWLFTIILLLLSPLPSLARVTGYCVDCHTMHNSQNASPMTLDQSQSPNPALLVADCIGCHTGPNSNTTTTPYVFDYNPPAYQATGTESNSNTLAGGSFYWVQANNRAGHNVLGVTDADTEMPSPPGGDPNQTVQLRCAGIYGCHGDRTIFQQITAVKGSHHYKDHTVWQDGSTMVKSYRTLNGAQGLGDEKYEYQPTDLRHNKYYGTHRNNETVVEGTISSICADCHGDYHNGSGNLFPNGTTFGTGVWLRHPTDFNMTSMMVSSTEYQWYNNSSTYGGNTYSVITPVATSDTTATLNTTIYTQANDAVVMCLSCHRAHGSPYNGSLRWNYKDWPAGGYNGCAVCHTSKN